MSGRVHVCECGVSFVFRRHESGKKSAPITTIASDDGNIAVNDDGRYRIIKNSEGYDGPRYLSHFVNCPQSQQFRRTS